MENLYCLTVDQKRKLKALGEREFIRVDDALDYIREHTGEKEHPWTILIRPGEYYEKLTIDIPHLTLIGENRQTTILTYNDYANKPDPVTGKPLGAKNSQSVLISPSAGGFSACNLTFRNHFDIVKAMKSGMVGGTQSLALHVAADKCVFLNCNLISVHDTLYTPTGRHYFKDCFIQGDVDFIFGGSQSVFESCELFTTDARNRMEKWGNKGYVCAPNTPLECDYGYLFYRCRLTSDVPWPYMVYLGRCYGEHAAAAFIQCHLGPHIRVEGFTWMGKEEKRYYPMNARFAEYGSTGEGAVKYPSPYRNIITKEQALRYTPENVWGCHSGFYPDRFDGYGQMAQLEALLSSYR